jgi:hypothetical protein
MAALKKRKQQLENQLMLLQNRDAIARRKQETRRRILIGAERLNRLQKGELTEEQLRAEMDKYLTRKGDRELFGLDS